ncbi:ThuA domain-containing protein [Kribbella solani]|uniref:Type 1 glutamine amidotransferase n=1 Tax=Kribbella solani TaxID=236067 RepID=A0A841DNQ1_9ACTN|nr:type 1 glutamine amidotransferase [Kribbella solani]
MTTRRAVVVRGGWEGHSPVEATDLFIPFLEQNGYEVTVSGSTEAYLDLDGVDLIVQCVTMSEIEPDHFKGLDAAIRRGTGFAGWHGGIADSFRKNAEYSFITGGQFISHPHGFTDYRVDIIADDPIVDNIAHFDVHTEQYYVHADPTNNVLATTTFEAHPDYPWIEGAVMPVIWTRTWGEGKVFVCTVGHKLDDLETPEVRTIIERGLLWASK